MKVAIYGFLRWEYIPVFNEEKTVAQLLVSIVRDSASVNYVCTAVDKINGQSKLSSLAARGASQIWRRAS